MGTAEALFAATEFAQPRCAIMTMIHDHGKEVAMGATIGAGEFKAKCLHFFGAMAGSVARQDDLVSLIGDPWEADV